MSLKLGKKTHRCRLSFMHRCYVSLNFSNFLGNESSLSVFMPKMDLALGLVKRCEVVRLFVINGKVTTTLWG